MANIFNKYANERHLSEDHFKLFVVLCLFASKNVVANSIEVEKICERVAYKDNLKNTNEGKLDIYYMDSKL